MVDHRARCPIGVALTLCGRGKMNLSALKSAVPCLLMNMGASLAGTYVGSKLRATMGNPVNVITGGKVLREDPDFHLPGPMPLELARFYSSHDERSGMLGRGWSVPYEVSLTIVRDPDGALGSIVYCDAQCRSMAFPPVAPGQCHYSTAEGYYLICTELGQYLVESADGTFRDFGLPAPEFAGSLGLQRVEDRNANWHALDYDDEGRLAFLRDNCGRRLEFTYSDHHLRRVAQIFLQRGAEGERPIKPGATPSAIRGFSPSAQPTMHRARRWRRTCVSRGTTWTAKRVCTTTRFASTIQTSDASFRLIQSSSRAAPTCTSMLPTR